MKSLIAVGSIYAIVAVLLVITLVRDGLNHYAWRLIFILVIGAAAFLFCFIESRRAAKDIVEKSGYGELERDMKKLLEDMRAEMYGDADEGKEPITLGSPVIGLLTYRRKPEWYEGESKWCGSKIKVTLCKSIDEDPYDALAALEGYFRDRKKIDRMLRGRVAEKKGRAIAKRMFPTNITLTGEGTLELDYADSECQILGIYDGNSMKVKIRR